MKLGMSKREARARVLDNEITWGDLKQLLVDAHPILEGDAGKIPSRVNKAMSLAFAFNVHWRAIRGRSGALASNGDRLSASNLLRDFGVSVPSAQSNTPDPHAFHQELIDIHNDDAPLLEHWTRNNTMHRWESKDGEWCAYDQWSCGRLTDWRRADGISQDNPVWREIYEFAKSRTAGRIDDGRQ